MCGATGLCPLCMTDLPRLLEVRYWSAAAAIQAIPLRDSQSAAQASELIALPETGVQTKVVECLDGPDLIALCHTCRAYPVLVAKCLNSRYSEVE